MAAKGKDKDDKKKKVDWSCRNCTKGAKRANRSKGHLNYASSEFCRQCGDSKGDCHLCAFSDLDRKLREWNDRGGQSIPGAAGGGGGNQKGDKKTGGKTGGNTPKNTGSKKEAAMAKQISDLQKQVSTLTGAPDTSGQAPKAAAGSSAPAAAVALWKRNMNHALTEIKFAKEEKLLEAENATDKERLEQEFEKEQWIIDLRVRILGYQTKIDAALPKEQRARNFDAEIQEQTKQLKANEAAEKKTGESIEFYTKKNAEAKTKVIDIKAALDKLKVDKEQFLRAQGLQVNSFDSFFNGPKWEKLRANASVGTEALDLMEKLTKLELSTAPAVVMLEAAASSNRPTEAVEINDDEDMDAEDFFLEVDQVAAAEVKAASDQAALSGSAVTAEAIANINKNARASVRAAGRFKLIGRNKKPLGKPTLVGGDGS